MNAPDDFDGVIVSIGRDHYPTQARAGAHTLAADEPASAGGANTGPTPYQLLLAALGSCKAITLRMYADRKGWPLEQVICALRHTRRHAEDCEDCGDKDLLDVIDVELQLLGPLSEHQRDRLLQIADRCPVHRTLTTPTRIRSRLVAES